MAASPPPEQRGSGSHVAAIVIAAVTGLIFLTGPPLWWQYAFPNETKPMPNTTGPASSPVAVTPSAGVIGFRGGCEPYTVYAQNRWKPYGAAVRSAPDIKAKQVSGVAPNQPVAVTGWVHAEPAYPRNPRPFDSDIWFFLADGSGWVSFPGVRAVPTFEDPTLADPDGGQPAPIPDQCQGFAQ